MTEEELTEWEHRPNIIKVLISYEMGAWLSRRDDRLLDRIQAEIDEKVHHFLTLHNTQRVEGLEDALNIIGKYKAESEDKE